MQCLKKKVMMQIDAHWNEKTSNTEYKREVLLNGSYTFFVCVK